MVKIIALVPLALIGTALACAVITLVGLRPAEPFWLCYRHDFSISVLITLMLGVSMGLYEVQRQRLDALTATLRARELAHERERKMALEAQLASLEARLQPHFMFNTLNAISALIQDDPAEAERTVERLAALLRFSLDATERGLVPLEHELKIVTDYLDIERTRFGDRLAYAIEIPPDIPRVEAAYPRPEVVLLPHTRECRPSRRCGSTIRRHRVPTLERRSRAADHAGLIRGRALHRDRCLTGVRDLMQAGGSVSEGDALEGHRVLVGDDVTEFLPADPMSAGVNACEHLERIDGAERRRTHSRVDVRLP